jgi:hypothetical protein
MTKSDAMWIGYWAMRVDIEACLQFWLKRLARGTPDPYWEGHIETRVDAAMIFYSEYRRLNRPIKRRRRAA